MAKHRCRRGGHLRQSQSPLTEDPSPLEPTTVRFVCVPLSTIHYMPLFCFPLLKFLCGAKLKQERSPSTVNLQKYYHGNGGKFQTTDMISHWTYGISYSIAYV
jgi:hypothetical protein